MSPFQPPPDPRPDDRVWPAMVWPDPTKALINEFVRLTRTVAEDAPELFAALDDPEVWTHLGGGPTNSKAVVALIEAAEANGRFMWTVRDRSGRVVGMSSYLEVSPDDARLEIGWTAYAQAVWGTCVNPATKLLLLTHAFADLHVGRVQLKTDIRNIRSQQALARLGATFEGTLRRYQRRGDETVRDTVLFSVTAEDWPLVRAGLEARLASG